MAQVTLNNVLHVVHFEGERGRRGKGMLPLRALDLPRVHELVLPVHDMSGLRHIAMDDFGLIVRGCWWLLLQMAIDSPVRGYLLHYAGDGVVEPLAPDAIARRLGVSRRRWFEILDQLLPAKAGVLERIERFELDVPTAELAAYETRRQGELFAETAPAPPRANKKEPEIEVRPEISERLEHPKHLADFVVAKLAQLLRPGGATVADNHQWRSIVGRCLGMLSRRTNQPATTAEQAERLERLLRKAEEISADAAVRSVSGEPIHNPPAVLAAWAQKRGLIRGGSERRVSA